MEGVRLTELDMPPHQKWARKPGPVHGIGHERGPGFDSQ